MRPDRRRVMRSNSSEVGLYKGVDSLQSLHITGWGGHLFRRFCKLFSESSPHCWAVLQLPRCPSKQGELIKNIFHNLGNKWPPHPVLSHSESPLISIKGPHWHKSIQGYSSDHGKGFVKSFLKVPLACLGSVAAAVQPNGLGNSLKTFYKTFPMT